MSPSCEFVHVMDQRDPPAHTSTPSSASFPWDPPAEVSAPLSELPQDQEAASGGARSHLPPHIGSGLPGPPHSAPPAAAPHSGHFSHSSHCTRDMEATYCSPLQLPEDDFLFDCEALMDKSFDPLAYDPASDPGYFSAGSSLSPTSSVDSFCFSPTSHQAAGNENDVLDCFLFNAPAAPLPTQEPQSLPSSRSSTTLSTTRKSRSRYPGKKRQTASEREKLRMRDLTKAMHHLRSYLPPSVAPAGQTLTKIDTLRLTIRYISYLSDQLGLSQEALEQRRPSGFVRQPQTISQFLGRPTACNSPQEPACSSTYQPTYQVSGGLCFSGDQYWTTQQQQLQHVSYNGHY